VTAVKSIRHLYCGLLGKASFAKNYKRKMSGNLFYHEQKEVNAQEEGSTRAFTRERGDRRMQNLLQLKRGSNTQAPTSCFELIFLGRRQGRKKKRRHSLRKKSIKVREEKIGRWPGRGGTGKQKGGTNNPRRRLIWNREAPNMTRRRRSKKTDEVEAIYADFEKEKE